MPELNEFFDPLMLMMKIRDSNKSGDPSHVRNYLQDTLVNFLTQMNGSQNKTIKTGSDTDIAKQIQETVNRSLSQVNGVPAGLPNGMTDLGGLSNLPEYIQNIIQQSLNQTLTQLPGTAAGIFTPNNTVNEDKSKRDVQILDTHDHVFVRAPLPDNVNERMIGTRIGVNKVYIRWVPGGEEQVIQIPADISSEGAAAEVKNRVLEIRIPKEHNPPSKQVKITHHS